MFRTRLISGIVLVLLAILFIHSGGAVLLAALLVISVIGMSELYNAVGSRTSILAFAGYAACAAYYLILYLYGTRYLPLLMNVFIVFLLAVFVLLFPKYQASYVMLIFFGLFYVAFMLSYIYRLRILPDGRWFVWLTFFSSWGCDTCAYCTGVLFGKHKLAPKLSPKKSIEGSIGGIVGAALLGLIFAAVINGIMGVLPGRLILYPLICGIGAVISQIGDLAASGIKRNYNIKDYGRLIPGHGGILDRFDSVIFTAPIIYYLGLFFS